MFVTYGIIDPRTKHFVYIGQTGDFERRKRDHLTAHRARTAPPKDNIKHWLRLAHAAKIKPEFIALEIVETEAESLNSEMKWIEKISAIGHPLYNKWDEHREAIEAAQSGQSDKLEAMVFHGKGGKRKPRVIGYSEPNKAGSGLRVFIEDHFVVQGPTFIDLLPPKGE